VTIQTRWAGRVALAAALAPLSLTGCSTFWDDVTSREFRVKHLFVAPDPLVVLRESSDGDARAKALRRLKEPKRHGGTQTDQDYVVDLLTRTATTDRQPLCRLAAIDKLGEFQDPRAGKALIEAFYQADRFAPDPGSRPYNELANRFPADVRTRIQCQALVALGKTRAPEGLDLLTTVLKEPPVLDTEEERRQQMDVRIAAARALSNYKDYRATETLVQVLKKERDVALCDRVHDSLVTVTGKNLPPDAQAWDDFLHAPHDQKSERRGVLGLVGWRP
jgi:hypothetical protein